MPAAIFKKRVRTDGVKAMPRRQTSEKFFQFKKSHRAVEFVIRDNRNEQLFIDIKDDNGKLWVEVPIVTFFLISRGP